MITRYRVSLTDPTGQIFYVKKFFANGSPCFCTTIQEARVDCNLDNFRIVKAMYNSQPGYRIAYITTTIPSLQE